MASKISKKDISKLLNQWRREFGIFIPSRDEGVTKMARWDGKDISFLAWYRNTVIPTKANFFPPMEKMFSFEKDTTGYQVGASIESERQLVFAIRPCDARALAILDMSFKDGYEDPYYLPKRKNSVLIGLGCTRPFDSCFCTSLGISPAESNDVDLMLVDIGDELLFEEISDQGKKLLSGSKGLAKASGADLAKSKEAKEKASAKVVRKVNTEGIGEKLLALFENKEYWEKTAAKCLACGVCTFLCPTCFCFDINDERVNKQGARFRNWDTCAFCVYTRMPMENPREEKWQRVRQKVCHKYEFYPKNFGVIACTGCGRCIRLCPVNWDISQELNRLTAKVPEANRILLGKHP